MKEYKREITITLDELALLCLNVDYKIKSTCRDAAEELSVDLQKRFKFDTHKYRQQLAKIGLDGAI